MIAAVRDPARAEPLREIVRREGLSTVEVRPLDVTRPDTFPDVVAAVREQGRLDVLVHNAGIGLIGAIETLDDASLREVFETNLFGAIGLTRALLPLMRPQGSGRIVFMSAIGALLNTAYFGAYGISKAAISSLAATLDAELRPFGIRASAILPGAYRTPIADKMRLQPGEGSAYEQPARRYHAGLTERIRSGPADLSPVVEAILDAATNPEPRHLYLVAPRLAEVLQPVVDSLEHLHAREVEMTRPLQAD